MKTLRDVPPSLWDDVAARCGHATFFHTRLWADVLRKTFPDTRVAARAFAFGDDDWAILPMMSVAEDSGGFFWDLHSNVPGVYGGVIANRPLSPERVARILSRVRSARVRRMDVFGNPYAEDAGDAFKGWRRRPNFTQVIDLDRFRSEEDFLGSYTHNVRNHVHRARREGYRLKIADSPAELEAYYALYARAIVRWGEKATGGYGPALFRNLFDLRSENISLRLAFRGEALAGGVLGFLHGRHWTAWHSAFAEEDFPFGVAKLVHHQAILDAKARGARYYDFNPSGGHEGTVRFKDMFNAERKPFDVYTWDDNKVYGAVDRVRRLFFWRKHDDR